MGLKITCRLLTRFSVKIVWSLCVTFLIGFDDCSCLNCAKECISLNGVENACIRDQSSKLRKSFNVMKRATMRKLSRSWVVCNKKKTIDVVKSKGRGTKTDMITQQLTLYYWIGQKWQQFRKPLSEMIVSVCVFVAVCDHVWGHFSLFFAPFFLIIPLYKYICVID